jgi:hypothetical protein
LEAAVLGVTVLPPFRSDELTVMNAKNPNRITQAVITMRRCLALKRPIAESTFGMEFLLG